jgi:hypothetical protein
MAPVLERWWRRRRRHLDDGGLHDGTIVNHRVSSEWVVSFRPIGDDPTRRRTYTDPDAVVHAIIERRHNND